MKWINAAKEKPKTSGYYFIKSRYGKCVSFYADYTGKFDHQWNDDFDSVYWLDETE